MTTFYGELCTAAASEYITLENKKQAVLQVVRRWAENNKIINEALAGKIRLEILVGPITMPNLRLSLFNQENDTFDSGEFREWSDRLFGQLGAILPFRKIFSRGYPKDFIDLRLPVKISRFYEVKRHLLVVLVATAILLLWTLWTSEFILPIFWRALVIGAAIGSCLEMFFFCLNASFHFHRRRQMAGTLLRQAQNIDQIFREISLG